MTFFLVVFMDLVLFSDSENGLLPKQAKAEMADQGTKRPGFAKHSLMVLFSRILLQGAISM